MPSMKGIRRRLAAVQVRHSFPIFGAAFTRAAKISFMIKWTIVTGVLLATVVAGSWVLRDTPVRTVSDAARATQDTLQAELHYQQYCGGCHGEKMDAFGTATQLGYRS